MNTVTLPCEAMTSMPQLADTGATVAVILAIGAVAIAIGALLVFLRNKQ